VIRHLTSKNISVLITDHNAREVSSIVDHSYLIQDGRVTHSGTISDLLNSSEARSTYFGEDFEL
jgi:lipopolysaccharide export system ATP-binding protein